MINYFKIIRPINLLLIVITMVLIRFRLFEMEPIPLAMDYFSFTLLVFAILCIAAAGNVINDLYDIEVDTINKPNKMVIGNGMTESAAFRFYLLLNMLGVGAGFWVANLVGKPGLAILFILTSALLYWYATYLKSVLLVGNLVISLLVGISILTAVLFDLFPEVVTKAQPRYFILSKTVFYYSLTAVVLNFIREIVKDIQDINGDKNGGRLTLPIVLGTARTTIVVFALGVFCFFLLLLFCYDRLYEHTFLLFYFLFLIGGPLGIFCIRAWQAEKKKDYARLSILLKMTLFFGAGSLAFINNILH